MTATRVQTRRDGAVLIAGIDRPRRRDTIDLATVRRIRAALRTASQEADARATS